MKIPDIVTVGFFIIALIFAICTKELIIPNRFLAALLFFLIFLLVFITTKGLGFGDVKLAALLGFCFGFFKTSAILIIACFIGLITFLTIHFLKHSMHKIPFAPFVTAGCVITELCCRWN